MQKALHLAQKASSEGEIPVGAVIIDSYGTVIGEGYNRVEALHSQAEHAEIRALKSAGKALQSWRLSHSTLYVTLEPCIMCMGLILLSRVERVVYAAPSHFLGYSLDKEAYLSCFGQHLKNIEEGVCKKASSELLHNYFKKIREKQ